MNSYWKFITVEPILFFWFFGSEISNFATSNLYLQKACRNDTFHVPDLRTPCDDEKRGVQYVSTVYNSFQFPGMILSLVITVFASSYSDLAGKKRRVFMITALVGQLLRVTITISQTIFWSWSPLQGIILGTLLESVFGGWLCLFNFMYAYLFDKTSIEDRLTRVTVLSVVQSLGILMGKVSAGFLVQECGFLISYSTTFVLNLMALMSAVIFVQEEDDVPEKPKIAFKHVLSLKQISETFVLIMLPKKPKKYVASIWLLLLIDVMVYFSFFGELAVFYLYFRHRFHWDEEKFGLYSAYRNVSSGIGGIVCTLVMSKWLKFHDSIIGAFAAFCDTFAVIGLYFAQDETTLYLVPLFDIFHGLAMYACISLVSQFFTEQEFGRLNSMKMTFLTMGMGGIPVYSILFTNTMETHPNAIFLLSISISVVICILYGVTFFLSRDIRTFNQQSETPMENRQLSN